MSRRICARVCWLALSVSASAFPVLLNLSGICPPGSADDFFSLPFDVPPGTVEFEASRRNTGTPQNILDFGVWDPNGVSRGWSGGNLEPAVIGVAASSRSYTAWRLVDPAASELLVGTWAVVIGKAQLALGPCTFEVLVTLRDNATLAPQPFRGAYVASPPLSPVARWYAGDFHVHGRESGDAYAAATLDEIADYARGVGLDFVHMSDHNTIAANSFMVDAQPRHPDLLLLPGVEWTTYNGHAGAILTSTYVDHRVNWRGITVTTAAAAAHAQGGFFSVNHFDMYELGGVQGNECVGCQWDYRDLDPAALDAIEVGIEGYGDLGRLFSPAALDLWDKLQAAGFTHLAPIGGSDDHHGGNDTFPGSRIGQPTTMIRADNLSHSGVAGGLAAGRVVLKMYGPDDPMVEFNCNGVVEVGGTCVGGGTLTAVVTAGAGGWVNGTLAVLRNNAVQWAVSVPENPAGWKWSTTITPPTDGGTDRWRAELRDAAFWPSPAFPRTLTNHIFVPSGAVAAAEL